MASITESSRSYPAFSRDCEREEEEVSIQPEEPKPGCLKTCIGTCLEKGIQYSVTPLLTAWNLLNKNDGCLETFGAKALFLAQLIVSIVSLPFIALTIIFSPALACISGKSTLEVLKLFTKFGYFHIQMIPTSLITIFSTSLGAQYAESCLPELQD